MLLKIIVGKQGVNAERSAIIARSSGTLIKVPAYWILVGQT